MNIMKSWLSSNLPNGVKQNDEHQDEGRKIGGLSVVSRQSYGTVGSLASYLAFCDLNQCAML